MKKKFSKIFGVGLTIALVASLLLIAAPVGATTGVVTPVSGSWVSGELTMVVTYTGTGTPDWLEMDIQRPAPLGDPVPTGLLTISLDFDASETDPYSLLDMDLAAEIGLVSVDYDATAMRWTIVIDTTKKCEVCNEELIGYGWMPGQEVWFDGTYNWTVFLVHTVGATADWDATPYDLDFDNPEDITPNLGLDAKGAEQWFWLNYIDVIDQDPLPTDDGCLQGTADGWVWAFVPGVNLETWGDPASPFDVIVEEGGRPYQDSFGTWHPAPCVANVCTPDRFIHIWSRAPELGDCEVKVFLADLPDTCTIGGEDCEPLEICDEVASAEKKWGELNFSKLDVHIDLSDVEGKPTWDELKAAIEDDFGIGLPDPFVKWVDEDHEIDVSAGTCTWDADLKKWDCTDGEKVHEKIAEWVWCDFLQLPEMLPAGGALVHWWLAEDSEANQEWIQDLMDEIVVRSAGEGGRGHDLHAPDSNDYWSATGDYDPALHTKDIIMNWIDPPGTVNDKFATATDIREFLPSCCCDPYLCKSTPMGDVPYLYPDNPYSWYGRSLTMDHIPGEIPGVSIAHLVNYAPEDVLIITLVEYQEDYNGENLILIEIGKKHFRKPPPPVHVKIPQVWWAGEKIVIEKDWGEEYAGNYCTFTIDQDSIGVLVPVLPDDFGWGNGVETCVMEDGVARVIFETEYEGQAEVKCVLYDCECYGNASSEGIATEQVNTSPIEGCQAIGNHDFPLFYLKLESIEPIDDTPEPVDPFEDAYFGVQVKGWFWSKTTEKSGRLEKWIDIDPLRDSLPNVINGGNGIPDDDHDQYLPAGRWVLPDDWPTLAGIYELRRHWDLMNNWEDQLIWSAISPFGPFNSAVVTTAFPGLAEAPVIGPFNTTQPVAIEDEVIKWVTTASVWGDYWLALPDVFAPAVGAILPAPLGNLAFTADWTVADLRNTVVPDGKIEWFDCPMSPAKVIFQVADQLPVDLFSAWKLWLEPYTDTTLGIWYAPYYAEEIPSSWFIPVGGIPEGYNWDSWGMWTASLFDDGPYPFWWDLGLTTMPDTDDEVIEVYSDNNGIAYVGMHFFGTAGEARISALVDYPYQRKHTALRSKEVTQVWGPIELNPHFLAEETVVLVDELVTFTNETAGGTHPYVRAAWDFDGDGIADIVFEDPFDEAWVMQDAEWAYEFPGVYSVILTMTDSTPTTRWEERPNYILVHGEGARKGDFTGDGHITFEDFVDFAACYGCVIGDPCYNEIGDFNDDGIIDFLDFVEFAAVYGT